MVSREELLQSVWGAGGGSAEALNHAVSELRHALDDHVDEPRLIQTVPKQGYRLLVEPRASPSHAAPRSRAAGHDEVTLFEELKRRGVLETGLAYLFCGWLAIQVADVTFDQLALPASTPRFVTYLVIVGFPIALLLAWFIEITEKGAILDVDPGARARRRRFTSSYVAILGGLASASLVVFAYDRYIGLPGEAIGVAGVAPDAAEIAIQPNSIAVLPFSNIDETDEVRIFSAGLTEDLINLLFKVPGLIVSSRGDSHSLSPNTPSREVRTRLRVAHYIEGSVRLMDGRLRVVVQLIDSETGFHVLSREFERERKEFRSLQDEITRLIVANLRVALPATALATLEVAGEDASYDAYLLYRRGMDILHEPLTVETIAAALDAFRRSLGVDPDYAAAHAGICMTYASGYAVVNKAEYISEAERACATALGLNANLYVVHNALGKLHAQTGNNAEAENDFQRALSISPEDVDSLVGLGQVYYDQQRLAEAEQSFRHAIGLQPGNWNAYNELGRFLFRSGRYAEAAAEFREVVGLDEQNMDGWTNLASALMLSGDFVNATASFERSLKIDTRARTYNNLGILHYYLGELDEAEAALEEAIRLAPDDHLAWSNLGDILSFAGKPELSREAFETAEKLGESRLQVNRKDALTTTDVAWIKAMLDDFGAAERLIAEARTIAPQEPYVHYIDALIQVRRGEPAAALDKLDEAVEMGYSAALLKAEPHLASLRNESRFKTLIDDTDR
jgi:serine/threonine-protein kinase